METGMSSRVNCCSHRNILSTVLSRELHPERKPSILIQGYRSLVRKSYRRASGNSRKVFKTRGSLGEDAESNPVYDLAYSPVCYQGYRLLGVGDELGYLSIVKVGFEERGRDDAYSGNVFNRGVQTVAPVVSQHDDSFEDDGGNTDHVQPVLYTLAWNSGGDKVLTGYGDGSIRVWDLGKGSRPVSLSPINAFEKSLKRVAWCGETMISCSRTNEICVHDQRMKNHLANRINCSLLSSKLTDICVLSDHYIVASSSNQSGIHLFDLRLMYKLYKRIIPVQSFDLTSPGYTTMKYDKLADDGVVYALGSDSVVRSFDYRSGGVGDSFSVPGRVDFFTKIDVDRFSGVLVAGGMSDSAWGFDLFHGGRERGDLIQPFFQLKEGRRASSGVEEEGADQEADKENEPADGNGRSCSAVALGTRRGVADCGFQIACGGDNSTVIVYD